MPCATPSHSRARRPISSPKIDGMLGLRRWWRRRRRRLLEGEGEGEENKWNCSIRSHLAWKWELQQEVSEIVSQIWRISQSVKLSEYVTQKERLISPSTLGVVLQDMMAALTNLFLSWWKSRTTRHPRWSRARAWLEDRCVPENAFKNVYKTTWGF